MLNPSVVIRAPSLAGQVYEQLTRAIVSLEIAPGTRIVIEQVASLLGVSRTPLREALPRLVGDGLLEELPNGVLRVLPITKQYVREVHQTRSGLEATAAFLAASLIPSDTVAELEQRFRVIEPEIARGEFASYFEADAFFHETVVRASGNSYLGRVLRGLHNHVYRIRNFSKARPGAQVLASHAEHLAIVKALAVRNVLEAKGLMETHVLAAAERVASLI